MHTALFLANTVITADRTDQAEETPPDPSTRNEEVAMRHTHHDRFARPIPTRTEQGHARRRAIVSGLWLLVAI